MKLISCVLSLVHSLVHRFFLPLYHYIRRVVAKLLRVGGTTPAGFENMACLLCVCVCIYIYIYMCVCIFDTCGIIRTETCASVLMPRP